jgi:Phage integrase family
MNSPATITSMLSLGSVMSCVKAHIPECAGVFRKIAGRSYATFRCHDLRHHFASLFAQRTGDLAALQAILGHKTIAMTMRCSHLMSDHLHLAMRKAGAPTGTNPATTPSRMIQRILRTEPRGPPQPVHQWL